MGEIRSVRIFNPFLWKRLRRQKLGILDMAMEVENGTKVNIEMQVRPQVHWVRRQLFYLAKIYTEVEEYHSAYWLRDKRGRVEGKTEDILQLLGELGNVSDNLRAKIMVENNMDTLNFWLKTAAKTETIDMFREICKL